MSEEKQNDRADYAQGFTPYFIFIYIYTLGYYIKRE